MPSWCGKTARNCSRALGRGQEKHSPILLESSSGSRPTCYRGSGWLLPLWKCCQLPVAGTGSIPRRECRKRRARLPARLLVLVSRGVRGAGALALRLWVSVLTMAQEGPGTADARRESKGREERTARRSGPTGCERAVRAPSAARSGH